MIIPASSVIVSLVDFAISFAIKLMLFFWYKFLPSLQIFLYPYLLYWLFWHPLESVLYITALNVKYRDFRFIIPFIVQFGLYISPVGFSSSVVPEKWRLLYSLNPMVGVIDGFRWCILGEQKMYWPGFLLSCFSNSCFLLYRSSLFPENRKIFRR